MNLTNETLTEIEDYIQNLDETIGLESTTLFDINNAINKYKRMNKCEHKRIGNYILINPKTKKLKELNQHNGEARSRQYALNDQSHCLNGIACPKCGEELYDTNPMITLTSYPAQKNVNCSKCDYIGYRIA